MTTNLVAALCLELNRAADAPLFHQLYIGIRAAILAGRLAGGVRLPPTRALAAELRISRQTVVNAFEQLIAEGYLEGKVGAGTYVALALPDDMLQLQMDVDRAISGASARQPPISRWARSLAAEPPRPTSSGEVIRAFQPGVPALDMFPYDLWWKLASRHWRAPDSRLMNYGHPQGYWPLREAIAGYLKTVRGIQCEPAQIIMTSSARQTFGLVGRVLLEPADLVGIEDPGYPGARTALEHAGARVVPIPVDQDGLQVAVLSNANRPVRLVYVTPSHQYPLGVTMSLSRRLALLEWAVRTGAWILEDDYDSEYRYGGRPLAALQGLDQHGCVLYMGTFSKVLLPSLRLGYLVVPLALIDTFARARAAIDRQTATIDQAVLAEFINEGHFARHIRRMKGIYMERQAVLVEAAHRVLAGALELQPVTTGLHLIGWLPRGADDWQVYQGAQAHGVDAPPLSAHAIQPQPARGLLLGYACVSPPAIRAGVERLARAFDTLGSQPASR